MRALGLLTFAWVVALGIATAALAPARAQAEDAATAEAQVFDAAAKRAAIDAAARLLIDDYVYPEAGAKAATMLRERLEGGAYDAAATPEAFAAAMTKDLQDLTHDKHLNVFADGKFPMPEGAVLPRSLFGFARADRLKGNIGYIVLNGFLPKPVSSQGADAAMRGLAQTDALIIDLRNNNGGDPAAVAYLVSFFFDGATPVHINDLVWRKPGTTDYDRSVFMTEPTFVSYLGKPVYVLTSDRTFSGGEEFAYDMQALKRGTIVGEVTGGGANPGHPVPLGPRLEIFMPTGRGENPVTGTSWEGKGVQPDIAVPEDQSFAVAYGAALKALSKIGGKAGPDSDVAADAVTEARLLEPWRVTAAPGGEAALRLWIAGLAEGKPPVDQLGGLMQWIVEQDGERLKAEAQRLGALQSLRFVEVDDVGEDSYEAVFAHGTMLFTLVLEPDGKIALCWSRPK